MYRIVGSIYLIFLLLLTLGTIGCSQNINDNKTYQTLWYDQPANGWEDALPLGNGCGKWDHTDHVNYQNMVCIIYLVEKCNLHLL